MKINGILKIIGINLRNFFRKKLEGKKTFVKIICKILNLDENNILSVTNEGGQWSMFDGWTLTFWVRDTSWSSYGFELHKSICSEMKKKFLFSKENNATLHKKPGLNARFMFLHFQSLCRKAGSTEMDQQWIPAFYPF